MDDTRLQVLRGAYDCIARRGMAKTTVDDVAAASGVSRATIYRLFPGGKEELLRDTVGWEMDRFFLDLGVELGDAADFPEFLERALPLARRELLRARGAAEGARDRARPAERPDHRAAAPGDRGHRRLLPAPPRARPRARATSTRRPTSPRCAEYVARLSLSLIASPGRHDLGDPAEVHRLVRRELLGGVWS